MASMTMMMMMMIIIIIIIIIMVLTTRTTVIIIIIIIIIITKSLQIKNMFQYENSLESIQLIDVKFPQHNFLDPCHDSGI